jgi:hypothetical protein
LYEGANTLVPEVITVLPFGATVLRRGNAFLGGQRTVVRLGVLLVWRPTKLVRTKSSLACVVCHTCKRLFARPRRKALIS